jgi:hypothetical protein
LPALLPSFWGDLKHFDQLIQKVNIPDESQQKTKQKIWWGETGDSWRHDPGYQVLIERQGIIGTGNHCVLPLVDDTVSRSLAST